MWMSCVLGSPREYVVCGGAMMMMRVVVAELNRDQLSRLLCF